MIEAIYAIGPYMLLACTTPLISETEVISQYTNHEWQSFLKSHGLESSMSRRDNCHDNAVAESFSSSCSVSS
ncbi:hypothetical protein [Enterobacter sp.]|uniref:hypothetical protein n=1 Tax=Enterobacter sp. TaxID=42895 RepID=UPI00296FCC01|nr:hypothetical protein [Enterobacter sp.]